MLLRSGKGLCWLGQDRDPGPQPPPSGLRKGCRVDARQVRIEAQLVISLVIWDN